MHKLFLPYVDFRYLPQVLQKFCSTNADNETFCTVLLTSQVVMVQSLQPKGRESILYLTNEKQSRYRSAVGVNCCIIIHCLEVSCNEDQIMSVQCE